MTRHPVDTNGSVFNGQLAMALQSQMARNSSRVSGTPVGRKRGSGMRLMLLGGLVLAVGAGVIYVVRFRGPQEATAGITLPPPEPLANAGGATPAPAAAQDAPPARPSPPEPDIVDMGALRRSGAAPVIGSGSQTPNQTLAGAAPVVPPAETTRPSMSVAPTQPPVIQPPVTRTPVAAQAQVPAPVPATVPATAPAGGSAGAVRDPLSGPGNLPGELAALYQVAERHRAEKKLLDARAAFNRVLVDPRLSEDGRASLRQTLSALNEEIVFSPTLHAGDPMQELYTVVKGDNLIRISRKLNTVTEAHFIERVNRLPNANALRVGQKLKVVRGPFHAVVSKSGFRLDLYAGTLPTSGTIGSSGLGGGAEPGWTYIRSFRVGLGENNGTPLGTFVVRHNSKLINPHWVNPRTGEKFDKDDPKTPIGEHWIGLDGFDDASKQFDGYGIHGTIEPDSIGREMSMGCVRLGAEDVEMVYELLMPKVSIVKIVP